MAATEDAPNAPNPLQPAAAAARQNALDTGCWLITTGDALERVLNLRAGSTVAGLNSEALGEAIGTFGKLLEMQLAGAGALDVLREAALREARPMGRA